MKSVRALQHHKQDQAHIGQPLPGKKRKMLKSLEKKSTEHTNSQILCPSATSQHHCSCVQGEALLLKGDPSAPPLADLASREGGPRA